MPFRSRSRRERDVQEHVEPLNPAELEWVDAHVRAAHRLLVGDVSAASLDELWAGLRSAPEADPNDAINTVGLALGQLLVDRFGLEWVALTDEHGTEVAVRGPANLTVFPTNLVAKRYESGETGFIEPIVDEIARVLA